MEGQTNTQVSQSSDENTNSVSFPTMNQPQKKSGGKPILVIVAIVIVAILGFIIFKSASSDKNTDSEVSEITPVETFEPEATLEPTESPSATSSPVATDKSKIKVQVLNGTGVTGEASYLETQLKTLGYTSVTTGNATDQTATATKVVFSKSLSQSIVDEITKKLNTIYVTVNTSTSSTQSTDVVITTGQRKGASPAATAKPSTSPTPTATQ